MANTRKGGTAKNSVATAAKKTSRAVKSKAAEIRNLLAKNKTAAEIRKTLAKKGFPTVYYSEIQSAGNLLA